LIRVSVGNLELGLLAKGAWRELLVNERELAGKITTPVMPNVNT